VGSGSIDSRLKLLAERLPWHCDIIRAKTPGENGRWKAVRGAIQANIDEVSGKREEALQIYRSLDQELKQRKDSGPRISQRVRDAVQRLSH
jgi:hypothetical protein